MTVVVRQPPRWWLLSCAVLAVVAVVLRLDWGPLPEVTRFRDDAFYLFSWVRSVLEGRGPTVSDGVPTSGVHVLWCGVLLVPGSLLGAAVVPAAAQVLGLVCHGATAAALGWGPDRWRWLAGLLWLGNPWLVTEAQNGQETALGWLLLVCLWRLRRRPGWGFGAVMVGLVLARSDLWLVAVPLACWRARVLGRGIARGACTPGVALLVHAAVNAALAGAVFQDSAWPMPYLMRAVFLEGGPGAVEWAGFLWWWGRPVLLGWPWAVPGTVLVAAAVWLALPGAWLRWRWSWVVAVATGWLLGGNDLGIVAVVALLVWCEPLTLLRGRVGDLRALLVGCLLLVALHFLLRQYPRDYYFAVLAVPGVVAVARARWGLLVMVVVVVQGLEAVRAPARRGWQEEMVVAASVLERWVPAGDRVGCFNAGILGWYRPGVVNLDGVVNRAAFAALGERRLLAYLGEQEVRWIVDYPVQVAVAGAAPHACGRFFGRDFGADRDLVEVARFAVHGDAGRPGTGQVVLWGVGGDELQREERFEDLGPWRGAGRLVLWSGGEGAELSLRWDGGEELLARGCGVPWVVVVRAPAGAWELAAGERVLLRAPL